jgi:CRP-like cAMP-binding protein
MTTTEAQDQLLQHFAELIALSTEEQDHVRKLFRVVRMQKKQIYLHKDDICQHYTYVADGLMRSYVNDTKGDLHILRFASKHYWIHDLGSFLDEKPARFYIDALEDSILLQISKEKYEWLFTTVPQFNLFFRKKLQRAFVSQQDRILSMVSMTAEERYKEFMERYPTLEQRLPQHQIAAYLGMRPEFLSRIRKNWAEKK